MTMVGEVFSLLCALVWALAIILFRVAGTQMPALELNLLKNTFAFLMLAGTWAVLGLIDPSRHAFSFSQFEIVVLVLSGLLGISLADTLLLRSLALIGASRNAVISCLYSPFVVIMSVVFLGEGLGGWHAIGFGLVVGSTLLISLQKTDMSIPVSDLRKGSLLGILSVFFIAVGMISTKAVIGDGSVMATATVRVAAGMLGNAVWILLSGRTLASVAVIRGAVPWKVVIGGAFLGSYLALIFWILGFQYTSASTASVLNQTSVLFTLVFAALLLHERMNPRKVVGALLGFSGVVMLLVMAR